MSGPRIRLLSFLSDIARDHYAAAGEIVARDVGLDPAPLTAPGLDALPAELARPGPAIAFLCGLPYVRARDAGAAVAALAAPVAAGSALPEYTSDLVVRAGLDLVDTADLAGRLIGVNGYDSLSGWVLPRQALAARGLDAAVLAHRRLSGSHHESLRLVRSGEIDAAAIDSFVLALEARADAAVAQLRVIDRLGPAPSPPVVLINGDPRLADGLRRALTSLRATDSGRQALALGLVERYAAVDDASYDPVRAADAANRRQGTD